MVASAKREVVTARLKVGMEVHVELATRTKMFTRVPNVAHPDYYDAEPNSLIDPVVAALPGALPVMNKRAVELSMMVGLALQCRIAPHAGFCKWDRKNYFYPDLPKGYQISQYDLPLCEDGSLEIQSSLGGTRRIRILRAHLEEDTGKLGHELPGGFHYDGSLIDLNRAGTPLLEIVTHPDINSADDAVTFGRELRNICCFLGVTGGIMQRGHMRFEPNVNVIINTGEGRDIATPIVEVKNLNSFKSLRGAIEYELKRQVEQWKNDGVEHRSGLKSTRGWDDVRGVTFLQREKEEAHDYRYFPDPDLVPVVVSEAWLAEIKATVPELPMQRRARYQQEFGLTEKESITLTEDADVCLFYEAAIAAAVAEPSLANVPRQKLGRECGKWLLNAGAKRANERGVFIHELGISAKHIATIIAMREANEIGSTAADELFGLLCEPDHRSADVRELAKARGLVQVRDEGQLEAWVAEAIAAQTQAAADFAAGKDAAAGRLVGHVMKISKGQADAGAVAAALRRKLRA